MAIRVATPDGAAQVFPWAASFVIDEAGRLHITGDTTLATNRTLASFNVNAWSSVDRMIDEAVPDASAEHVAA